MSPHRRGDGRGQPQPDWLPQAACRKPGVDRRDFHPEDEPNTHDAIARAKAVCAPCPVRALCLEYGLAVSVEWGIWGGLTAKERQRRSRWIKDVAA